MPEPRLGHITGTRDDRRSPLARASDALPARFYDPARGREEPRPVIEARRRWQAAAAMGAEPDPLHAIELAEMATPLPEPQPEPVAPAPVPVPDAVPARGPAPSATRCGRYGYPLTAIGHQVACGEQAAPEAGANGHAAAVEDPRVSEIGRVTDGQGREVIIGTRQGRVTVRTLHTRTSGAVELTGDLAEDFAQLLVAAAWQAAAQSGGPP